MHRSHLNFDSRSSTLPARTSNSGFNNSTLGYERSISPRYDKNEMGYVNYIITVDVSDFHPNDVKVNLQGSLLIVDAKRSSANNNSSNLQSRKETEYKEFRKEISLPGNIDYSRSYSTNFIGSGLMEISLPTVAEAYSTLYPPQQSNFLPHTVTFPKNPAYPASSYKPNFAAPLYTPGLIVTPSNHQFQSRSATLPTNSHYSNNINGNCYTEEIVLDSDYRPEDVSVTTKVACPPYNPNNKVIIKARFHQQNITKEFNDERCLPHNADLDRLKATFTDRSTVIIEVPYKTSFSSRTPLPVSRC